jgi:hypothetical protein
MALPSERVTVDQLLRVLRAEKDNLVRLAEDEKREDYSIRTSFGERLLFTRPRRELLERADVRRFKRDCNAAGYSFDDVGLPQWIAIVCRDQNLDPRNVWEMSLDDFSSAVGAKGAGSDETGQGGNAKRDLVSEWRRLSERFLRNASESEVKATEAIAGALLPTTRQHGLQLTFLEPSAAELQVHMRQPDVIAHLWSTCWTGFVIGLSLSPAASIPNPVVFTSEHRGGPNDITVGSTDKADWRIRAENYAAVCDRLADEVSAMKLADPVPANENHVTSSALPISRQFFAGRFRELAEPVKLQQVSEESGEMWAGFNAMNVAGELFIAAVDRGYLQSLPGAHDWVATYREALKRSAAGKRVGFANGQILTYPNTGTICVYRVCPHNLFLEIAGGPVKNDVFNDGGKLIYKGATQPMGLLPDALRNLFPKETWPLGKTADEARDIMQLRTKRMADRCALACRLLADLLEQEQATSTATIGQGGEPANGIGDKRPKIIAHGSGCYSIAGSTPKRVDENEDYVLQTFLAVPALNLTDLEKQSGVSRPNDVLKRLRTKYGGIFAPAIHLPSGKGQGGYHVSIRPAESA